MKKWFRKVVLGLFNWLYTPFRESHTDRIVVLVRPEKQVYITWK